MLARVVPWQDPDNHNQLPVHPQTLCHIFLSQVQRHLSKLFDNMAKMQFQLDASQNPTKTSLGMYSKEEEYVAFSEACDCSGQVSGSPFPSSYLAHPFLFRPSSVNIKSELVTWESSFP